MAGNDAMSNWAQIREGANDVERLLGQKQYNLAMVKSRQTLELMVRCLADNSGIRMTELGDTIDKLYKSHVITRTTAEHYHKIRMIGNRAAHEGEDTPSGANLSYQLISQELYTFANDFSKNNRRPQNINNKKRRTVKKKGVLFSVGGFNVTAELLFKIIVPIVAIILAIALVKHFKKEEPEETVAETEMQTMAMTVEETVPAYVPETTKAVEYRYVINGEGVRIRSTPDTSTKDNVIATAKKGEAVEYIEDFNGGDMQWIKINYGGSDAYVCADYVLIEEVTGDGQGDASGEEAPEEIAE